MSRSPVDLGFALPLFDQIDAPRRHTVLEAAAVEFSTLGYNQATMASIARRAGVSVGSLYQYFPDKEALYLTVVHQGFLLLEATVGPIVQSPKSLEDKLEALVNAVLDQDGDSLVMTRLYLRFTTESEPALASRLADTVETFTALHYGALIQDAMSRGLIHSAVSPAMLAFAMDSLLLVLQFSLAGAYYRTRMQIYLGPALADDPAALKAQVLASLRQTLGLPPLKGA